MMETAKHKDSKKGEEKVRKPGIFSSWTWKSFLFVSIFHCVHILLFIHGWMTIIRGHPLPGLSKLKYSVLISRGAAVPLSLDLMLLLLPMCHITLTRLRLLIKWIPLEHSGWFHRQVAYTMLFYTIVHTAAHYVNFYLIEKDQMRPEKAMQIHYTQFAGVTGHIMIFCMIVIYTFSHEKIRKQSFETFLWVHRLFIVFLFASWFHSAGCFIRNTTEPYNIFDGKKYWAHCIGYQSWRWETWFSVLYILERLYAHIYIQRRVNVSKVVQHPSNTLEIQFDRAAMNYRAGQWIFLQCPDISKTQWHPFSISSCPYDPYVSVHIRQIGDFTQALRQVFEDQAKPAYDISDFTPDLNGVIHARPEVRAMPEISIEGPYGSPIESMFDNEIAILIGAGIGVTPWASVLKSLWHVRESVFNQVGHRLRRVEFIWICKDITMFEWFQDLITSLNDQSDALVPSEQSIRLSCHTYITRPDIASVALYKESLQRRNTRKSNRLSRTLPSSRQVPTQSDFSSTNANNEHYIHTGRPDFKAIFKNIRESLKISHDHNILRGHLRGKNQIGVNFCGPKSVTNDIRLACKENMTSEVKFKFKKESF